MQRFLRALLIPAALMMIAAPQPVEALLPPNELERSINDGFQNAGLGDEARLGVFVADATTGERLAAINETEGMTPASLVKLFTAAAALDTLGLDHRFRTSVAIDGDIDSTGHLYGRILIRGGGDPALGPRFQDDRQDVSRLMRMWSRDLKAIGLRSFDGMVIGDERLFQGNVIGTGWDPSERAEWWSAEVSALTFNDGCVSIAWDANRRVGSDARYTLIPQTEFVQFTSTVKVVSEDNPYIPLRYFRHAARSEQIARGSIPQGMRILGWTAVEDPARFTAHLLVDEMRAAKITGEYRGVSTRGYPEARLPEEAELREVLSYTSPPLQAYLVDVLTDSQNLYAECIARAVAIATGEDPSFEGAAAAITSWAEERSMVRGGFALMDGSGLSALNMLTPRSIGDLLLSQRDESPNNTLFREALAVAGESGTLATRLEEVSGRFSGKTGVLRDATSLAGYLRLAGGREFAVVIMIDNSSAHVKAREQFVDSLLVQLDNSLAPTLTALR